jgi:hypothetical protein
MTDTSTAPYDRAARRLADNQATRDGEASRPLTHADDPGVVEGSLTRPLYDDVLRATYPDPKVANLKGNSPIAVRKRELAEQDRGGHPDLPAGVTRSDGQPVTRLPDGTPATNKEAVTFNTDLDDAVFTDYPIDAARAVQDRHRDAVHATQAETDPLDADGNPRTVDLDDRGDYAHNVELAEKHVPRDSDGEIDADKVQKTTGEKIHNTDEPAGDIQAAASKAKPGRKTTDKA